MVVYDFFNFSSVYEKLLLNNLMAHNDFYQYGDPTYVEVFLNYHNWSHLNKKS